MDKKVELLATGPVENLRVADHPPQEPGSGEIRLRHQGIGINFVDIYHRIGLYPLPLPAVLGVEGAGVVEAIGSDVTDFRIGDRIVYAGSVGAYASTRILPAWRAVRLPENIDAKAAATSFFRGLTAHMLLTRTYSVGTGTTLLVHAAAGGLGTTLTRWAKSLGATVIGTVGSYAKAEIARTHGIDHVIVGRDTDIAGEIAGLTDGKGVDFAIDGIGGATLGKTLSSVRRFGVVASIGQTAGPIPMLSLDELGPARSLSLARPSVMAYAADPQTYRHAAQAVIDALARGIIPTTAKEYTLVEAAEAHRDLESGTTAGGLLLLP